MRKDNSCRMTGLDGGELSLKQTVDTTSMKKALHRCLNWAFNLRDALQNHRTLIITCAGVINWMLLYLSTIFIETYLMKNTAVLRHESRNRDSPNILRDLLLKVIWNRLGTQSTIHLAWNKPPSDARLAEDMIAWQFYRVLRFYPTYMARLEAKPWTII